MPIPDPAEAAELLDSTALALLSLGVLVLVVCAIWLGRELMASRLSVRMLAENQRLARREQQHKDALQKRGRPPRSGKVPRSPGPPPLPDPQDWSDSGLRTEPRPDASEFPLAAGANKPTEIWPWRKLPRKPDDPDESG